MAAFTILISSNRESVNDGLSRDSKQTLKIAFNNEISNKKKLFPWRTTPGITWGAIHRKPEHPGTSQHVPDSPDPEKGASSKKSFCLRRVDDVPRISCQELPGDYISLRSIPSPAYCFLTTPDPEQNGHGSRPEKSYAFPGACFLFCLTLFALWVI